MSLIPPGPAYIARHLPGLTLPPLLTYGALHLLERDRILVLPRWAFISLIVAAKPAHYILSLYATRIRNWWKARKRGAQVAPHIEESWPYFAGLSLIPKLIDSFQNGYPLELIGPWSAKYGNTFELRLPTETQIWTTEPEHVKALLATQFDNFEKGAIFIRQAHSFLGTGVFNSDGEMWKFHRGITRPFFSRDRISDFDTFDKHAEQTLALAKARLAEGYAIDFQDLIARFTLDSAVQFLFGSHIDSLQAGIPYPPNSGIKNPETFDSHPSNIFVKAFLAGLEEITIRMITGEEWPFNEFWRDRVLPYRKIVDDVNAHIVEEALTKQATGPQGKAELGEGETLLGHLVSQTQDLTIIKDELLNLLVAGRDTTACTLTFSVYMLAQHPHVVEKLRSEILNKVGEKGRPSYDDLRDMKYLRAFINEVLRQYPPVPFNNRTAIRDTVLTKKDGSLGIFVPGGTQVGYSIWDMHRRKDLWGPDADEFDPDRFLDERLHKYLTPNPFIFSPFNAGPRICLGQQFAYNESSFFLVRLLQQFSKFSLALDSQPPETIAPESWKACEGTKGREKLWPGANLTLFMKGGLWVRME